jgi:hypothetical protein
MNYGCCRSDRKHRYSSNEGSGASFVVLIALLVLFGAAAYFTGRLYGTTGIIVCAVGLLATVGVLYALG